MLLNLEYVSFRMVRTRKNFLQYDALEDNKSYTMQRDAPASFQKPYERYQL